MPFELPESLRPKNERLSDTLVRPSSTDLGEESTGEQAL